MKTRKPIATISYNTDDFLVGKLEELRREKIISVWFYVNHQAEEDEKKAHKHLWIMPAKSVQTDDIVELLVEPDEDNEKPLKCLHFQPCNSFADWYLYSCHDAAYLWRKGQSRQYHYRQEEFICSDCDELDEMVRQIDMTENTAFGRLLDSIAAGISFDEFVMRGGVPLQQFATYKAAWDYFSAGSRTDRAGRETHSPKNALDKLTEERL